MLSEKTIITIRHYTDPFLANIHKTKLEANSIPCQLTGGMNAYMPTQPSLQLRVFEEDVERAEKILSEENVEE